MTDPKPYTPDDSSPPKGYEHARPSWDRVAATVAALAAATRERDEDRSMYERVINDVTRERDELAEKNRATLESGNRWSVLYEQEREGRERAEAERDQWRTAAHAATESIATLKAERDAARATHRCQCGDDDVCHLVTERDEARADAARLRAALKVAENSMCANIARYAYKDEAALKVGIETVRAALAPRRAKGTR